MKRRRFARQNRAIFTLMAIIVLLAATAGVLFAINYKKNNQINSNAKLVFCQGRTA